MNKKFDTKLLVMAGILVALHVVLSRFFSINAWNIKIGFAFVPVFIAAYFYGPVFGGIVGALGDFLGAILFPIGAYFPGFTATCFMSGLVMGAFLHKEQSRVRTIFAVTIDQLILGLLVNSFWISILYGSPYVPLLATRTVQCLIMMPVMYLTITALIRILKKTKERLI